MIRSSASPFEQLLLQQLTQILALDRAEEGAALLRQAGYRLSGSTPLSSDDLAAFEQQANFIWSALGLGSARLGLTPHGVTVHHRLPSPWDWLEAVSVARLLGPLLEGWYEGWFHALAGGGLTTRLRASSDDEIELIHGPRS